MLLYGSWVALPLSTRVQIAEKFGIKKKGMTHVINNHIQSDGYEVKDIESAITLHSMQDFLGTEEEGLNELWEMMVAKIEGREARIESNYVIKKPLGIPRKNA